MRSCRYCINFRTCSAIEDENSFKLYNAIICSNYKENRKLKKEIKEYKAKMKIENEEEDKFIQKEKERELWLFKENTL